LDAQLKQQMLRFMAADAAEKTEGKQETFGGISQGQSPRGRAVDLGAAFSREPGGKGSFQAVKLQRPARTTVCSHSTRDMAAMGSIESKHDNDDTQDGCLSSYGQL
jgi:hypothetical protein